VSWTQTCDSRNHEINPQYYPALVARSGYFNLAAGESSVEAVEGKQDYSRFVRFQPIL